MKAALTVWDGRMSPVFDVSREALVLTLENGAVVARSIENIETPTAALKLDRLTELGVETLDLRGHLRAAAPRADDQGSEGHRLRGGRDRRGRGELPRRARYRRRSSPCPGAAAGRTDLGEGAAAAAGEAGDGRSWGRKGRSLRRHEEPERRTNMPGRNRMGPSWDRGR